MTTATLPKYTFRADNGGEYQSKAFQDFLREKGIKPEESIPYIHQQNGDAERFWGYSFDSARALLLGADLDKGYWGWALLFATYVRNRTLTTALPNNKTPYEVFYGKKPDLSTIRTFGCTVYIHDPRLVGIGEHKKGYIVHVLNTNKFQVSRTIRFLENSEAHRNVEEKEDGKFSDDEGISIEATPQPEILREVPFRESTNQIPPREPEQVPEIVPEIAEVPEDLPVEFQPAEEPEPVQPPIQEHQPQRRPVRNVGPATRFGEWYSHASIAEQAEPMDLVEYAYHAAVVEGNLPKQPQEPTTYEEASKIQHWQEAGLL